MRSVAKTCTLLMLTTLMLASCSSAPEAKNDPYSDADSQRSRAQQTQDELSKETR